MDDSGTMQPRSEGRFEGSPANRFFYGEGSEPKLMMVAT